MRILLLSTVLLAACSSTGVIPTDSGSYMIAKQAPGVGWGPPIGIRGEAYTEANEFCGDKAVETIKLDTVNSGFARSGAVNLEFRCVDKVASDNSSPSTSDVDMETANAKDEQSDPSPPSNDKYDNLARLKKLLDDGTLTQEEFDREKAKILNE